MADKEKAKTSKLLTAERTALKAGDKVEYDGKLAKVVEYGFLELPTAPTEPAKFTDELRVTLQLPADTPGGRPEYAFFVDPSEVKSLKDDPKRLRSLEMEFNPLFGDKAPVAPAEPTKAPEIRQKGRSAKQKAAAAAEPKREPIDMVRAAKDGATVKTNAPAKASKKASKKGASK